MKRRWRRRLLVIVIAVAALGVVASAAFGPLVRREVLREAERRGLSVEIDAVRPSWVGARLLGVRVRPRGVTRVSTVIDEVRVEVGRGSRKISARGGRVDVSGTPAEVRRELAAWRAAHPPAGGEGGGGASFEVAGIDLHWDAGPDGVVDATGVGAAREAGTLALTAEDAHFVRAPRSAGPGDDLEHARSLDVRATSARIELGEGLALARLHADAAEVTLGPADVAPDGETASAPLPHVGVAELRARAEQLAARVAERLPEAATVDVSALVVHAGIDVGPAAFSLSRTAHTVDAVLVARADDAGRPAIDLHATVPSDDGGGDLHVRAGGGPLRLAALGLRDHTFGLTDLDQTMLSGHADVALGADGALRFDVDGKAHDLSIDHRRLSSGVVRGLDVGLRARGTLDAGGTLAFDDAELALAGARLTLAGGAHLAAPFSIDARFEVPRSSCKDLIEDLPESLVPTVYGTTWDGAFDARGHVFFDARRPDDMVLDYQIHDDCKVTSVPERLSRDHFTGAFQYTAYDPQGRPREETTGPGTPGWTPLSAMSRYFPIAVIMTEDGGVYRKDGFNHPQIKLAFSTDLKERRFARGASTLMMQLAKNLFLARDKTIARKLEQVLLTEMIAQTYPKNDVLELYANVIEFGPDVYGVRDAAVHYFGKGPFGLSLGESLFLASMLPSPVKLHAMKGNGEVPRPYLDSIRHLMDLAHQSGLITDGELAEGMAEEIRFAGAPRPKAVAAVTTGGTGQERDAPAD